MKIAIIYNRDSQAVINLFGIPNREKYGLETINKIRDALVKGGHQVKTFEGDKNIIYRLEEFMPSVISGERPGLVFNLSYGIQGRGRYMHIPGILEMLGVPYVGSGPETHAIALDKVITKMILIQRGLPTPRFAVLEKPESPLSEKLSFPLIVKPKDEAVSFGLKIVNNEEELREGARVIYEMFKSPTLVEEYIEGREINIGLLGNDPVEALPPVELFFGEGEQIYTYEDKIKKSGREIQKVCPADLSQEQAEQLKSLAISSFKALGCFDSARVDFRIDNEGNPYILEVNSMASLGPGGSYVFAAEKVGLDYEALANKLIEIASKRYFGSSLPQEVESQFSEKGMAIFNSLTQNRDQLEEELHSWTSLPSWTDDPVGISAAVRRFDERLSRLGLTMVEQFTNRRSAWTWQTDIDIKRSTLLVLPVDVPRDGGKYPVLFRRDPEWLYGEGIASSRAPMVCLLKALEALHSVNKLLSARLSVFLYSDEGRGLRYSSSLLQQVAKTVKQVIVLQPGYRGGKIVDQRRGSRKYSILIEGDSLRIGYGGEKIDPLSWFLQKASDVEHLSQRDLMLSVAVQDISSERFSMLLPHRVRATIYVTYLDSITADQAEEQVRQIFSPDHQNINTYIEKLEERPSLIKRSDENPIVSRLKTLSADWKLPFGIQSSLLPSAAGVIPDNIPVVCGFGPASRELYTPNESVHRGELLQRALLLALYFLEE